MHLRGVIALAFAVSVVSACGGGGGGGSGGGGSNPSPMQQPPAPPPATPTTVSGTAATNTPLSGVAVEVYGLLPGGSAQTFREGSSADGRYSVTTTANVQPPFLIRTPTLVPFDESEARYPFLHSMAIRGGTANVTPLTQLAITRLLNRRLTYVTDLRALGQLQSVTEAQLNVARQQVLDYLMDRPNRDNGNLPAPVDVSAVSDFFSMPMTAAPGDPYFEALRRLHDSLMDSESMLGLEEHMMFRNDTLANLQTVLSLDFPASCRLENGDPSILPQGPTRIILNPSGAMVGNINLTFQTGDLVKVDASHFSLQQWLFTFANGTSSLLFNVFDGQLSFLRLTILGGSSICGPISGSVFEGKNPSIMALSRLFAQSIGNPTNANPAVFQCPASGLLFQNGANQIVIEANGALRVKATAGPALHLPSLNITIEAFVAVTAGQAALRPARFTASRKFRDGLYEIIVALNGAAITGVKMTLQPDLASLRGQTCGTI
jgi:hypothetical protein